MTTTLMLLAGERWPQEPTADWVLLDAARRPLDRGRSDPRHWPAAERHELVLAGSRVLWFSDFKPDALSEMVTPLMEAGLAALKRNLEGGSAD